MGDMTLIRAVMCRLALLNKQHLTPLHKRDDEIPG